MRVTIIVLNFNYARFVGRAIDSALGQTWSDCEVVVVDNGSTDQSLAVIERHIRQAPERARVVRQRHNIGQGQGYNLGLQAATGDWVLWLDADDVLDPDAIETCMLNVDARAAKIQFTMRLIDGEGQPLPGRVPYVAHSGDVTPIIAGFGHYAGPPGSGNVYRRSAIERYFPVEPKDWPIGTDTVPFLAAAFHGDVVHLTQPLGSYRLHRRSDDQPLGYQGNYAGRIAAEVQINDVARSRTLALLRQRAGIVVNGPFVPMPAQLRHRILSWRMQREQHPFAQDTAASLWALMWKSSGRLPGYSAWDRLLLRGWAALALWLPEALAPRKLFGRRDAAAAAESLPGTCSTGNHQAQP